MINARPRFCSGAGRWLLMRAKKEPALSRLFGMEVFVRDYSARLVRLP